MSGENPQNIIRSWNTQANFANGRVLMDRLVPPAFSRIRTTFLHTWREDAGTVANLDCSQNFSVYLPESLRVVRAIFLKIVVPTNTANFKSYPGLQAVKSLRIMSAGQEVYTADVERFLVDYCQSLSEEQLKRFSEAYLGHASPIGTGSRTLLIPLLLPNSQYMQRNGQDTRGFGVFPCFLGQNRLEFTDYYEHRCFCFFRQNRRPGNDRWSVLSHVPPGRDDSRQSAKILRPPRKLQHH